MKKSFKIGWAVVTAFILLVLVTGSALRAQDSKGWRQLFNGKDLTGWKHVGPGDQYVKMASLSHTEVWVCYTGRARSSRIA